MSGKPDQFYVETDAILKMIKGIDSDIKNRDDLLKKGQNISKQNQMIGQQLNKLESKLDGVNTILNENENSGSGISNRELDNRRKKYGELRNQYADLKEKYTASGSNTIKQKFVASSGKKYQDQINENDLSVERLKKDRDDIQTSFDDNVKVISEKNAVLKNEQLKMRDELSYQNEELLPKVQKGTDKNYLKLRKGNKMLNKLGKRGSDCCLWTVLIIEIVLFVYLLVFFQ